MSFSVTGRRTASAMVPGRGRAPVHLAGALLAALGEPPPIGSAAGGAALWVSDGTGAPPDLPAGVEWVDLVDVAPAGVLDSASTGRDLSLCVLDGVMERVGEPGEMLAWAYRHLRPGGRLVVGVGTDRAHHATGLPEAPDLSGERLAGLLFREGFEEPRRHGSGRAQVVSARRSPLAPPPQRAKRLSVVMPVYNEAATFQEAMSRVLAKSIPGVEIEIIVVESNSTDGSREMVLGHAEHPRVRVILEETPRGKGHAVRAGLAAARGDFVLIQDADLEYDVDDYDVLLEPLRSGEVGFVLGIRTNPGGSRGFRDFGEHNLTHGVMNAAHEVFLALFNVVYRQRLRDPFTMYKVFRRDCVHGLTFECNRFDFDWELTAKLVRAGYRPREIPVRYRSRSFHEGKKIAFFRDPLTWVRACFKYRFTRLYPDT